MARRLSNNKKLQILQKAEKQNLPISQVCRQYQISRQTFYKWRRQIGHLLLSQPVSVKIYNRTVEDRSLLIEIVSNHGFKVTAACKRLNVSRTTYYKWKKRVESGVDLAGFNQSKTISARKCTDEQIAAVLSLAYAYPEYSIRKIVNLLKQAGPPWSLSVHGVFNILKRHNLVKYEARLNWLK